MPAVHFTNLLIVVAVGLLAPLALGFFPRVRLPAIVLEIALGIVIGLVLLGGLAMRLLGFDFHQRPKPPSSEQAAAAWRPYIETCIEAFGPERCMFESNFPPDKGQCSYQVIFNAFKRIAAQYSEAEKTALFSKTATDVYRLKLD